MIESRGAKRVAVVVPAYNEEANIPIIYKELKKILESLPIGHWTVVFVDDGSHDKTLGILRALAEKEKGSVNYISFSKNFGHQTALKAGLDYVADGFDLAITMDADLQHPPKLIPKLFGLWEQGYDVVYTVREATDDATFLKNVTSWLFYKLFRVLTDIHLEKGAADFRLYDRKVLEALSQYKESNLFLRGVVSHLGFNQISIPYKAESRRAGQSSYSFKKMFTLATNGITSFSTIPLRLAVYVGFIFSLASVIYGLYVLVAWIFNSSVILPGWASIAAGLSFLGGSQLMFLGVIGIYIGKIFDEVKNRPVYLVKEAKLGEARSRRV